MPKAAIGAPATKANFVRKAGFEQLPFLTPDKRKKPPPKERPFCIVQPKLPINPERLTLACFKAWVCFVDHVNAAFAANDAAIAVTALKRAK